MRVANKVALITGAASGMGAATARLLAREGAKVVVADMMEGDLKGAKEDTYLREGGYSPMSYFE
jgi:NAD(P)-dependent dehydrogenase (short-subunit alcohol dehydrogenase family)